MGKKIMREHMRERFGSSSVCSIEPPLPGSLNIELNNTCNHKCEFCGFHGKYSTIHIKPSQISIDLVKSILRNAKELGIGRKELGFYMTGEPFLSKSLPEMIEYAKGLGFEYIFLTTNGALATPDVMKQVVDAGLASIRFSVNAADREMYKEIHGRDDFDTVVNNIRFLDEYRRENNINIATSLSCVVCKKNQDGLEEGINKIFSDIVDDILFIPVVLYRLKDIEEVSRIYKIQEECTEIDKDYVCSMLFNTMYINSDGYVVPCCNEPYFDHKIYDLNKKVDLKEAWHSEGYRELRNIFVGGASDKGTMCEDCILRRKQGVDRFSYGTSF